MEAQKEQGTEPVFRWSTDQLPPSQRLDAYVGNICERFIHVTTSSREVVDFHSELAVRQLGPLSVAYMGGSSQDAFRTVRDIARSTDQSYHLVIGHGPWRLRRPSEELLLTAGDLVLIDSRFEQSAHWPSGCTAHNVKIPFEWLAAWVPEPRKLVCQRMDGSAPWGRLLAQYVAQLAPQLADKPLPLSNQMLADQIGALLSLAATEVAPAASAPARTYPELQARIVDAIRERCSEPALEALDIARQVGVSVRTLHRVLSAGALTFGRLLIDARADVARRMLEAPGFDRLSLEEIGQRAGFSDASHFSRVCSARFGHTPSALRKLRPGT